jgi:hypothetical protein
VKGIRFIAGLVLVGAAAIVAWQLLDKTGPDATTLGLLLMALISTVALAYPKGMKEATRHVTRLDAFGIKLELQVADARHAIRRFESEEDGTTVKIPEWPRSTRATIEMIGDKLRGRLRFTSGALLGERPGISEEFIVNRLGLEGLLKHDEASICLELLGGWEAVHDLKRDEREELFADAWRFAVRFASRMFDRKARRRLAASGWQVADFEQPKGHRPDFLASRDGLMALVAARVAQPREGVFDTRDRLAKEPDLLPGIKRVVVVPDGMDYLWPQLADGPMSLGDGVLIVGLERLATGPQLLTWS